MKKFLVLIIFLTGSISNAFAQLSPGDLHKSHDHLEGIENCTKCHEQGKKLSPQNCLQCHTILKERIGNNKGLHANSDYKDCADCHVDHLGRNYKMIYWGKSGKNAFDHSMTGYRLQGAHLKLECAKCHNQSNIVAKDGLKQKSKDLNRTFLGLNQNCSSCHQDEHRGQLNNDCLKCHSYDSWQKAPGFNHNDTAFKLTGKHKNVQCRQCHKVIKDNKYADNATYFNFAIKKFATCNNCHRDVHNTRFGKNCTKCHNTGDWANYNKNSFNHNKTNYALQGAHATLRCEQCHQPGQAMKISRFQKCMDCHTDYHSGQFTRRIEKGACEECHTVQGFSPSEFTLEMHQGCAYPLKGSHLAVPCLECHKQQAVSARTRPSVNFRFKNTQCASCHEDIHEGEASLVTSKAGCEGCHVVNSWHTVSFDHSSTGFKLTAKHGEANCTQCHKQESVDTSQHWRFKDVNKDCYNCHNDVHQGQFNSQKQTADCGRCHSPVDWLADRFDHEEDSFFSLAGAHKYVSCDKCHTPGVIDGRQVTVFRPLDRRCESCHKG